MDNATYQEMPCISSHWLKDMLMSPAHCYRNHIDPQRPVKESTKVMQFGTLVHCLALTPLQFSDEFIIASDERRTKAGRNCYTKLAATGKIIITPDEFERAQAIIAKMKAHPEARLLLSGGKKEKTFIQERGRGLLPLKARLDIHHENQRLVGELKTIHGINQIKTTMERYRYPLSAAFYRTLAHALTVIFIFVQTHEPYAVEVFELSLLDLQRGHEQFTTALQRFDECWLKNEWPEAEPMTDLDDDPLMMPMPLMTATPNRQRFEIPVGELAL
ncbi:MAG: PD-(D/E)XK nuclease-like domain-containing protein [Candidatus Contendobacter sp.]|nr:PD-(D/E)XK nuclease-like domain-containing protein [Candidatus Contendobacter sp.]